MANLEELNADEMNAVTGGGISYTQVDPKTGEVLETLEMPAGVTVSGLEADGGDRFYCGGGSSGKIRAVRRPKHGAAVSGDTGSPGGSPRK